MENIGDLSKIISVIMENPELIAKIKAAAEGSSEKEKREEKNEENHTPEKPSEPSDISVSAPLQNSNAAEKRKYRELLCALKPYVSKERSKTIDTFISVAEIVGLMKSK